MTQDRSQLMEPNWPAVKINSMSRASIHILSRAIVVVFRADIRCRRRNIGVVGYVLQCHPGRRIPRMSGQCGASHTSVTLYHASKYGTGKRADIPGHDSTTQTHRIYLYDRRRGGAGGVGGGARGGGAGTSVSIRARVYGIRTFRGRRIRAGEKTRGTTSQTENTHS